MCCAHVDGYVEPSRMRRRAAVPRVGARCAGGFSKRIGRHDMEKVWFGGLWRSALKCSSRRHGLKRRSSARRSLSSSSPPPRPPSTPRSIESYIDGICQSNYASPRSSARNSFKDVTHITAEKLQEMQAGPVTLVDVRSPEERAISIIPGAVSLSEMPNPLPADAPLVLYCTGWRALRT